MNIINTTECYIDDKQYLIEDFIQNKDLMKKYRTGEIKIYDDKKNELVLANGHH